MANPSKAQLLADAQTLLKKRYPVEPSGAKFSVLEAVVYAICHENATMAQADAAMAKFKSGFFDWNEVRVSAIDDLTAVFTEIGVSDDEARAQRLRRFLRQLFEKTYSFTLDALTKKPLKDSVKSLQEYEAFHSDYILAEVSRLALGGHAIGIDAATLRVLDRLGLGAADGDIPALRASLERAVPKNRGAEFAELMEELAADVCLPVEPICPECELKKICPTGQERLSRPVKPAEPVKAAAKQGKAQASATTTPPSTEVRPKKTEPTSKPEATAKSAAKADPAADTKPRLEAKSPEPPADKSKAVKPKSAKGK